MKINRLYPIATKPTVLPFSPPGLKEEQTRSHGFTVSEGEIFLSPFDTNEGATLINSLEIFRVCCIFEFFFLLEILEKEKREEKIDNLKNEVSQTFLSNFIRVRIYNFVEKYNFVESLSNRDKIFHGTVFFTVKIVNVRRHHGNGRRHHGKCI